MNAIFKLTFYCLICSEVDIKRSFIWTINHLQHRKLSQQSIEPLQQFEFVDMGRKIKSFIQILILPISTDKYLQVHSRHYKESNEGRKCQYRQYKVCCCCLHCNEISHVQIRYLVDGLAARRYVCVCPIQNVFTQNFIQVTWMEQQISQVACFKTCLMITLKSTQEHNVMKLHAVCSIYCLAEPMLNSNAFFS